MNKNDFIHEVAAKAEITIKDTRAVIAAVEQVIQDALISGDEITLNGVGKFYTVVKPAAICRNPIDGSQIEVPERNYPKFKYGSKIKDIVKATDVVTEA